MKAVIENTLHRKTLKKSFEQKIYIYIYIYGPPEKIIYSNARVVYGKNTAWTISQETHIIFDTEKEFILLTKRRNKKLRTPLNKYSLTSYNIYAHKKL